MISKQQRRRLVRFVLTGLTATLVHIFVAMYLIELQSLKSNVANGCAFIVATMLSYIGNTYWSFSADANVKNGFRFWVTSSLGFTVAVCVATVAELLSLHYMLGIGVIVLIVPLMSFVIHSKWTFKE